MLSNIFPIHFYMLKFIKYFFVVILLNSCIPPKKSLNSSQGQLLRPTEDIFFTKDLNELLTEFNKNLKSYSIQRESTMSENIIWFAGLIQSGVSYASWLLPKVFSDASKYLTLAPILCKFFDLQNEIKDVEIYTVIPSRNSYEMIDVVFQQISSQSLTMQHPAKNISRKITSTEPSYWNILLQKTQIITKTIQDIKETALEMMLNEDASNLVKNSLGFFDFFICMPDGTIFRIGSATESVLKTMNSPENKVSFAYNNQFIENTDLSNTKLEEKGLHFYIAKYEGKELLTEKANVVAKKSEAALVIKDVKVDLDNQVEIFKKSQIVQDIYTTIENL